MKRAGILAMLFPWLAAAAPSYEASTNFDAENVSPFLHQIARLFDSGFSDQEVAELARFALETKPEKERERRVSVTYHGRNVVLVFHVFMDDIDAPDIYFFSSDEDLAKVLQQQMESFSEGLGQ